MGIHDITPAELNRGKKLAVGGVAAPIALTGIPAILTLVLTFLSSGGPPVAAVIFFVGMIVTAIGFFAGLIISGVLFARRSRWTNEMRERIAADGIKAEELDWFRHELKSNEKRALKAVEARDLLLADAYRETLASRLTATRIVKSSKRELQLARKRQGNLKQLKSARAEEFQAEIAKDVDKISKINDEAKSMLAEAESRLQMIEAAASRQGGLADSELALKKLSARSAELPLALEAAKMSEEIRLELEKEDIEQ
ncbi:MAG: hypothetical protein QM785_14120 [Pyrinomonadaceae bacterium]